MRIDLFFLYRGIVRPLVLLVAAAYFLFALALVVLRYVVLPAVDDYRPAIERLVGRQIGAQVSIGRIKAEWRGLHPSFELSTVQVVDPQGRPALSLPEVSAILSWRSLAVLQPRFLRLQLQAPELDLRRDAQGGFWIGGWPLDRREEASGAGWDWLLVQREVVIRGASVRWTDERRQAPPLEVNRLTLVLRNTARHHRMALRAEPPPGLAAPLDVRADFSYRWFAFEATDPSRWRGSLYLSADRVELGAWGAWFDLPWKPEQGTGALRAWLDYDRGRLRAATADLALRDARMRLRADLPELGLARLVGRAEFTATESGYRLGVSGLDLQTDDGLALQPERLSAQWTRERPGQPATTRIDAAGLDLDAGRRLADRLPLPEGVRAPLAELRPAGRLDVVGLAWQGEPQAPAALSVQARFTGLSIAAAPPPAVNDGHHPQRPGFANLNGELSADAQGGRIVIEARDAVLSFPGVFAEPDLPFDRLAAQAAVRRDQDGAWLVDVARLDVARRGLQGSFSGTWSARGRSSAGSLDLRGTLVRADVREVHRYTPLVAGADLRTWLRHALAAGAIQDVDVRVKGDLDAFPFGADRSGEFRVAGRLAGVTLDYLAAPLAPGEVWPRLEGLNGDLVFDRASMRVDVRGGRVRVGSSTAVALGRTRAAIADLEHQPLLEIEGETRGPAPVFLDFVRTSPVGRMIGGALDEATASGAFTVPLALRIPLDHEEGPGAADVQVRGEVRLAGNEFRYAPAAPALSRLQGAVAFDERGIALREVSGVMLDGPVRLSGGPEPDGSDLLRAEGTAAASALAQWWDAPGMARLTGRTAYRAALRIRSGQQPVLQVESDLVGLSADLPAPLGKAAQEARPSRLEWGGGAGQGGAGTRSDWFAGSLGPAINLHVERDYDAAGRLAQLRGAVGVHRPATIAGPGLSISADLPEVDVDALRKMAAEFRPRAAGTAQPAGAAAPEAGLPLNRINLATRALRVRGRQLDQVNLYAVREQAGREARWRADIESAQLAGRLSWTETGEASDRSRLTARLSRLVIDSELDGDEQLREAEPESDEDVPEIDLVADEFRLFGKQLGRLEVLAQRADRGREWRLRRLNVRNPDAELDGTGVWKLAAGEQGRRTMTLDAVLKLSDTGKFLERMGLHGTMAGGSGKLSAQVSWRGLPYSLDLPSLSGDVALELDKGQFLKAEPGIAKLLGVLSLQSLPRRVTLDFRDVFSEGFAYDTIRAHAKIARGVAHTDDFRMNGVNATVVIAGDTDLVKETQALQVVVVPKLDAGAASLLYGLVNPAVGLSVFLAQLLLKDPLAQVLAYQYAVTGTWADPQVAKVAARAPAPAAPAPER